MSVSSTPSAAVGRADAPHLADLRRLRRRLLFGGGALLTVLIVVASLFSAATRVGDFHAGQQLAFLEGQAAVDFFLLQRDRAYAASINTNDALWRDRRPFLRAGGQPYVTPFHAQGDSVVLTANTPTAVPWLVLGLPGKALAADDLAAYLGMVMEYSAYTAATITWQDNPNDSQVMYAYEPQGRLLAIAGVRDEAEVLHRLGVSTREQVFARLLEEETLTRRVKPQRGPVTNAERSGRLISRFGRNPLTGLPSLVGTMTMADGTTPYFRRVVFEPVENIRIRLAGAQKGNFLLITGDDTVVFSSGQMDPQTVALLKRWSAKEATPGESGRLGLYVLGGPIKGADWRLVHAYDWHDIWTAKGYALTWHAIAALGIIGLLWGVLLRMDRHLFAPALADASRVYESQMLSRTIIETSPVGLALIAVADGQPLLQNALAQQLCDAEAHLDGVPVLYAELSRRAAELPGGGPYVLAWPEPAIAGQRLLQARMARATFHDQAVWVCSLHDVTSQTELEGHLRQARQDSERAREMAEAASRAKTAFVAHMSHEIRTPLNGVLGHLELLGRSSLQPAQRERLDRIRLSADALMDIISDVLDFSKIEAGQLDVETEAFTLRPLIEQAALLYAPVAARKGLKLYYQIHAPAGVEYIAGLHRLRQILNNLLGNAVKFTESGRVLIRASVEEGEGDCVQLQLQVVDSGIGMSEEQLQQLFRPFQQADASIARRYGGSGLGLALCQQLAQVLGGHISAESTQGVGSVFTLQMPMLRGAVPNSIARPLMGQRITVLSASAEWREEVPRLLQAWGAEAEVIERPATFSNERAADTLLLVGERRAWDVEDEEGLREAHPRRVRAYAGGPLSPELREGDMHVSCYSSTALLNALLAPSDAVVPASPNLPITPPSAPAAAILPPSVCGRVMLVEDNPVNRELIQQQLEELGYQVDTAENGQVALSMWQDDHYQAVLTDINMPVMDGYTFAGELRRRGAHLPILAVTATALASERQRCRDAGIDDLLLKPLNLRRLEAGLRAHVRAPAAPPVPPSTARPVSERLRQVFVQSATDDLQLLHRARQDNDPQTLLDRLHAFKGALMMMGERSLGERCGELERRLREQQPLQAEVLDALLQDLQALVERYRQPAVQASGHD
jgi:two-component system capsular synthesis sensor histidine kinase RcsC